MATAVGPKSTPMMVLKDLIIAAPTFVAQCELENVDPTEQVKFHAYRPELESQVIVASGLIRPFCIIRPVGFSYQDFDEQCMQPQITIRLQINDKVRHSYFQDAIIEYWNYEGSLLNELQAANRRQDGLVIRTITQTTDATPVERREREQFEEFDFIFSEYEFSIGAEF